MMRKLACKLQSSTSLLAVCGLVATAFVYAEPASARNLSVCSSGCPYPTIQSAIDIAAAGDVVQIAKGRYVENLNTLGKRITLQGADRRTTIVDGNGKGTVITIPGKTGVGISDLTITRGYGDGGGITTLDNASINLQHCVVVTNHSTTSGGGLNVSNFGDAGTTVVVDDCTFSDNGAANAGGGLFVGVEGVSVTVKSSTFVHNHAAYGGGISIGSSSVKTLISKTSIVQNGASVSGGGLLWGSGISGNLQVDSSVAISNNSAGQDGGGVQASGDVTHPVTISVAAYVFNNSPNNCNDEARCYVVSQSKF
jgi:predicted outer membrane repeat protein